MANCKVPAYIDTALNADSKDNVKFLDIFC